MSHHVRADSVEVEEDEAAADGASDAGNDDEACQESLLMRL